MHRARFGRLAIVLLALLLGGCVDAVPDESEQPPGDRSGAAPPATEGASPGDSPFAPSMATVVRLPGPHLGGEPSLAIGPDGTAYVVAPAGTAEANVAWRSDDGGRSWTELGTVAAEVGTNDATIAIDDEGRVWVGTLWDRPPPGIDGTGNLCTAVSLSQDRGASWSTNEDACGVHSFDERPWLTAGASGAYLLHPCAAAANACLVASQDNTDWTPRPLPFAGGIFSPPDLAGSVLGLAFATADPSRIPLAYVGPSVATSSDQGATWSITLIAQEPIDGRFLQYASDGERAVVAWASLVGSRMVVRAAVAEGDSWGDPFDVNPAGSAVWPWVDVRDGRVLIAALHTEEDVHPHEASEDAAWRVSVWVDGVLRTHPFVVHEGPLCSAYAIEPACPGGRSLLGDFFSAGLRDDGTVLAAVGVDTGEDAVGFNEVPLYVIHVEAGER